MDVTLKIFILCWSKTFSYLLKKFGSMPLKDLQNTLLNPLIKVWQYLIYVNYSTMLPLLGLWKVIRINCISRQCLTECRKKSFRSCYYIHPVCFTGCSCTVLEVCEEQIRKKVEGYLESLTIPGSNHNLLVAAKTSLFLCQTEVKN